MRPSAAVAERRSCTRRALVTIGWPGVALRELSVGVRVSASLAASRCHRVYVLVCTTALSMHPSAWKWNSANFAFHDFCEVRRVGVLGSSHSLGPLDSETSSRQAQ